MPADFGHDSYYQRMLVDAAHLCAVTALIVATQADRQAALQGMREKLNKLSWLQIAAGTAGLTIAVAGSVASMGTLAPVFLLLGYGISATAGGAGLGASVITARIDAVHTTLEGSAGRVVTKQGAKGAAAVGGKQAAVRSAGALGGAGAASVASSALGAVGGAFGIASGAARLAKSDSRSNRVAPSEALGALPWQLVRRELTRVLEEIRADKRFAGDAMAGEFDRTIQMLEATIALLQGLADA